MLRFQVSFIPNVSVRGLFDNLSYTTDANGHLQVELDDFEVFAFVMIPGSTPLEGDTNGDGKVDAADLNTLAPNWQSGVTDAAVSSISLDEALANVSPRIVIPEPDAAVMLSILGVVSAARRHEN